MINGREAIFCPRIGAYRDPAKCEECKTEKPFEYRDCHELQKTGELEPDPESLQKRREYRKALMDGGVPSSALEKPKKGDYEPFREPFSG